MLEIKYKKDLEEIANKLGYEEQSMQLIEEMAELTQAINKHRRYGTYETKSNIIEEIADVCIVLSQVAHLLKVDERVFDAYVEQKIEKTKKRIAECGKNID